MSKKFLIIGMLFSVGGSLLFSQQKYVPRNVSQKEKSEATYGIHGALEHYAKIRNNQFTKELELTDFLQSVKDFEKLPSTKSEDLKWTSMGPTNQGGRVRAIIFDKRNPNIVYAGGVSGGLWRSTNMGQSWQPVNDFSISLIVSCMDQAPDGTIYYGTGEGFAPSFGNRNGSTGFYGAGIFKSVNPEGTKFERLESTNPEKDPAWAYVYALKVHPNGDIYAATDKGPRLSKDKGQTWENPLKDFIPGVGANLKCQDVDISTDGKVIAIVILNKVFISKDGGKTYKNVSTGGDDKLPSAGLSRIELDIAPSDPNYIYACAAKTDRTLHNVYRSTDGGETWTVIGPGGSVKFQPLGTQGDYNNVIKVHPTNKNKIYLGGLDMWIWEENGNWEQASLWMLPKSSSLYLHADHHCYVFHPQNPKIMLIGTDGGVAKTFDGGKTFEDASRFFVTTQFYTINCGPNGEIIGGTQDNGTQLILRKDLIETKSQQIAGGDGGHCAISHLNPNLVFSTVYHGDLGRSPNKGAGRSSFYNDAINKLIPGKAPFAAFISPIALHERIDDKNNPKKAKFVATKEYKKGEIVKVASATGYFFDYKLHKDLNVDDTIIVHDPASSVLVVGATDKIFMTREAYKFSSTPEWYQIGTVSGEIMTMSFSNCGNYLFVGTSEGNVYRISNFHNAYDSTSAHFTSPYQVLEIKKLKANTNYQCVNKIAVDPNNPNRILICLGNYGNTNYVLYSDNALSEEPTFTSKQGNLPKMPVYSAIFVLGHPKKVILGTELGIVYCDNIEASSPVWVADKTFPTVPVYDLKQQTCNFPEVTNYGAIYAGTHGRGVFECTSFVNIRENEKLQSDNTSLVIYPNPTNDFINLEIKDVYNDFTAEIYDLKGSLIKTYQLQYSANNNYTLNLKELKKGIYILKISAPNFIKQGKIFKN